MKRLMFCLVVGCSLWAAAPTEAPKILIYPRPQEGNLDTIPSNWQKWYTYNLIQDTILIAIGSADTMTRTAAEVCSTEISKALYWVIYPRGIIRKIWIDQRNNVSGRAIIIGDKSTQLIKNVLGSDTTKIPKQSEGYYLKVKDSTKVICAGYDKAGAFYAATTLRQLIAQHYGGLLPGVWVRDWPDIPWRQAFWEDAEVGNPDTLNQSQLNKLDYLSLLKCNRVEHMKHRTYVGPGSDPESPPVPDDDLIDRYNFYVSPLHLPDFWYPEYRARNIEPIPSLMSFGQPLSGVVLRYPSCIEGTEVKNLDFKFVGDTALPVYRVPNLKNPTFDSSGGSFTGWSSPTGSVVDKGTFKSYPASVRFIARRPVSGKTWPAVLQEIVCDTGRFYVFDYWIKTQMPDTLTGRNGGYFAVKGKKAGQTNWTDLVYALGPNYRTKWRQRIETTADWKRYDLGIYSQDFDILRVELGVELSSGAEAESVIIWVDGDSIMRNQNQDTLKLTNQQRFLIKTSTDRPKVNKGSELLTEGIDYTMLHDTLTYCYNHYDTAQYEGGEINDSSKCWVFKSLNPSRIPPGTIVQAHYDFVDWNDYHYSTNELRFNYCPLEPETRALVKTEDSLAVHRLNPRFIDHFYNEPTQAAIKGDSRCTSTNYSPAKLLADDIVFNLENSQFGPTIQTKILLSEDALVPQHNGKAYDSIWQAIKIIKDEHPSYPAKITPWIWGFNDTRGTIDIPYSEFQDSVYAEVDTFNHYGYEPILAYLMGSRELCLKWLRAYKEHPHADSLTGFTIHPDAWEAVWDTRQEFQMIPFGLEYAWNWRFNNEFDTSNSALYGDYPNSENRVTPWQLHKNYGDIFSPAVANFRVRAVGFDGTPVVNLIWSQNLNNDRRDTTSRYCYRIDRYDWSRKPPENPWDTLTLNYPPTGYLHNPLDTTCVDTSPYWSEKRVPHEKYWEILHFAKYRISSFDKLTNQSEYTYATAHYSEIQVDSTIFPGVTAYHCQKKNPDPEGVFHLTYTGGMEDTVVYYLRFLPGDTASAVPETLGIGKFPTIVVKPGGNRDTLGVAYLSQGSDTIYYTYRLDSLWLGPYSLVSSNITNGLSIPRMALDAQDTVHLTFLKRTSSDSTLTLYCGRFYLTNPQGITSVSVSRWAPTASFVSIDPLGAAVAVDGEGRAYFGWAENNTIKYGMSGDSGFAVKVLGSTALPCTSVAMHHFNPGSPGANVSLVWSDGDVIQRSYFYTGDTVEIFRDTVYSGTGPKNVPAQAALSSLKKMAVCLQASGMRLTGPSLCLKP